VAQHPSSLDIEVRGGQLFSANPAVQLDFGGIAKGFAVDIACEELAALGVRNAIVNAGGDLRAFGHHGERPWRVAIRNPLGGSLGGIEIHEDEAVFTSGNYERYHESATHKRYAHILDPRSGWPARQLMSATVVARDGWMADAAATALIVAGLSEWSEVASAMQLELVLLVDDTGRIHATSAMQERLIGLDKQTAVITLSRN
jgi:thiamine biosynthesis lipoprotein